MIDLIYCVIAVGLLIFAIVGYINELKQEKEYRREQRSLQYELLDHLRAIADFTERTFYIEEKKYETNKK